MSVRFTTMGIMALLAAVAVSSTDVQPRLRRAVVAPGTSVLHAYGGRSPQQRVSPIAAKFDAALADIERHTPAVRSSHALADLHALNPAARFKLAADGGTPLVAIDAVTVGDPARLEATLKSLGLEHAAVYGNDVGGWLPVASLAAAAGHAEVHSLRAVMARTRTGAVTSQGDFVQQSAAIRSADALTGAGVTVGVLSDSFNCYAVYAAPGSGVPVSGYAGYAFDGFTATASDDVTSGDLPADVNVLEEADCLSYGAPLQPPFGDEGRAMLQIVHDVAPGAALAFYTAESSEADFAAGITKLAAAGAKVIADDVGYFDEPFYQDGIVAQAIDTVQSQGVAYFSAAGNDANAAYENTTPVFAATPVASGAQSGEYLLNVDTSGQTAATALPVTIASMVPGQLVAVVVQWDQPYVTGAPTSGGATGQLDLCVTGATSVYTIQNNDGANATCTGPNTLGSDPYQVLIIANPADATSSTPQETLNISVGFVGGTQPGRVKLAVLTDGQTSPPPLSQYATAQAPNDATIQGHPGAAGAVAVGAAFYFMTPACGTSPAQIESYSSVGGAPILFSSSGTRLSTPITRQKPDLTGPDGGNDTFLGFTLASNNITGSNGLLSTAISACQNEPSYPNFFGTSAATPHVAGIAALMLQANAALTPTVIADALRDGALAMDGGASPNDVAGYGFVQATASFARVPPGAPTLTASASAVTSGSTLTLTWSSVNASSCAAAGGWSGSLAAGGTVSVTPTTPGTASYSLTCSNAAGTSTASSVSVTVTAPPSSGSKGGGAMDPWALLALAALFTSRLSGTGSWHGRSPSRN